MAKVVFVLFLGCFIAFSNLLQAQQIDRFRDIEEPPVFSQLYFSLNGGINTHAGIIGVGTEAVFLEQYSIYAGFGLAYWGNRVSIGAKVYTTQKRPFGSSVFAVYCRSNGFNNLNVQLENNTGSQNREYNVWIQQKPINSLLLGYDYNLRIIEAIRLNLQTGFMLRLSNPVDDFYNVLEGGDQIDNYFMDFMRFSAPGGIMISLGLSFRILGQ